MVASTVKAPVEKRILGQMATAFGFLERIVLRPGNETWMEILFQPAWC